MPSPANLLITNARVLTMDQTQPRAAAVAVAGEGIIYVGEAPGAAAFCGPDTRVVDAQGGSLLPGFIDSHCHLRMAAAELANAPLEEVESLEDLKQALQRFARENPAAPWICGSHLRYAILPGGGNPTRQHLDDIIADRPVALMAYDYHTLWANSRALEMAGALHGGRTGPNSQIVMAADGLASGELREPAAYGRVLALTGAWGRAASSLIGVPATSPGPAELAEDRALLRTGLALAARHGITSLHNMDGDSRQMALLTAMEEASELIVRLYLPLSLGPEAPFEALEEAEAMRREQHGSRLRSGFVKLFMDGVLESWTALLLQDYADRPGWSGESLFSLEDFTRLVAECDRRGLQVAVHAIGDGAVRRALDGFEAVQNQNGRRDSRHRIEHIELVHPDDLPRFARLGVIASMQPLHLPTRESDPWRQRAGQARWGHSFAWESLRRAGARLVFGSDWPVVKPNPLLGIQTALGRRPWASGLPDQRQDLAQALAAYTCDAAFAEFQESRKGRIRPAMLADLVLLSDDLESVPIEDMSQTTPVMTVCGGRIVYEA